MYRCYCQWPYLLGIPTKPTPSEDGKHICLGTPTAQNITETSKLFTIITMSRWADVQMCHQLLRRHAEQTE